METVEKAYAKLNITLDVLSRRVDGYHDMRMIMQTVSLCDDVRIQCVPGSGAVSVRTSRPYIPCDMRNIAAKAAAEFLQTRRIAGWDVAIHILKRIPVCAGMAGGSADAAAVLRGLERLFQTGFTPAKMADWSVRLGADVPYCVSGGTALAEGLGERLTPLPELPDCSIVVCKPAFSVSTPELFSRLDGVRIRCRPDTRGAVEALGRGDLPGVARRAFNVFEGVLANGMEKVAHIKSSLYDHAALGAAMTGTGSAVFGIFQTAAAAAAACEALQREYRECFLVRPVKRI